jgi:hypothetical protein
MNRMQKKELDFMSQMTHDNFIYNQSSSTPTGLVQPQLPFISQAEYPEIKRRLETCGSAENYQKCFRSGSSSLFPSHLNDEKDNYYNENENNKCDDDDEKKKLCQACHDFCPQEEMRSGFVGSGVFLQLQAGSSSDQSNESNPSHTGHVNHSNHSNLNYFVHDPKVIPPLGRNVNWQGTWDNKCKNTQFPTKPYQINY